MVLLDPHPDFHAPLMPSRLLNNMVLNLNMKKAKQVKHLRQLDTVQNLSPENEANSLHKPLYFRQRSNELQV